MSTQISTSTVNTARSHSSAPLRVPKRPPRNDVAQAIHKFLPYAVVFLLSLMLYSSFKTAKNDYPAYSPPNVGEDSHISSAPLAAALNQRQARLEDLKRRSDAKDVNTGHWASWRAEKMNELNTKKKAAEFQAEHGIASIPAVVLDAFSQAKSVGGKMVSEVRDFSAEKLASTQDFAYDAMYSWKQKAGVAKDLASEAKDTVSQAAYDLKFRNMAMELMRTEPFNRLMQNSTAKSFTERLASFVAGVKDNMWANEDARRLMSMKEEWEKVDVSKRADMIIQQLHFLGDSVIEEVFRKLDHERSSCVCLEEQRAVCH